VTAAIDPRSRDLLAAAAEWRLLSLLFDCPEGAWREQVAALAGEVADSGLCACARLALEQASPGLYHSSCGPGGPAALREVSYCDALQFGHLMAELRAYYDAFGYQPCTGEAPDHASVEAGFVSFLRMKEAFAHESGDSEHASVTAEAAARFCQEHICWMAEPLAARLAESGLGYLADAGQALLKRVGPVPRGRATTAGGWRVLNNDTFSCGDLEPGEEEGVSSGMA
jgi:nitrate reductase assembly molybdenum cofactor insertion protein NarJ